MQDKAKDILVKILECILQSRIDVKKNQIRKFDEVNKEINKNREKAYDGDINILLKHLLISEQYSLRHKISKTRSYESIQIIFSLVGKKSGLATPAEVWSINFEQYTDIEEQDNQQIFEMVSALFEEMLLFLNRQPLFSEYQRNGRLKTDYILDYEIKILGLNSPQQVDSSSNNIVEMPHEYTKERVCRNLVINIACYFLPKFDNLTNSYSQRPLLPQKEIKPQMETTDASSNSKILTSKIIDDKQRKVSLYEFYDKDLDFVFLSSDDESFKKNAEITEVNITGCLDDSEEFQLLMISKDEEFIEDNKGLFAQFSSMETQYSTL